MMKYRRIIIVLLSLLGSCVCTIAQESKKSELQQHAEADSEQGNVASARFHYIRAYEDYVRNEQLRQGVECGVKATAMYYKENYYKEAFDLLRRIDQTIADKAKSDADRAALRYLTTKERLQMYMKLRKPESAKDQLGAMEREVNAANDERLKNDFLYTKAVYHYTFGQNAQGNAVFKEMAKKLTAEKEYDKVDEVYQTLIANGRKTGNANMVAQSYISYIAWKDSVAALKKADETGVLKQQIADNETAIKERDASLAKRKATIVGLSLLCLALVAALVFVCAVLLRFMLLTRKQKKTIKTAKENIALKAKFISNISAQLAPTLQKLDPAQPEVKALQDFSSHIQTLSALENEVDKEMELEDTQIQPYCEELVNQVRGMVKANVSLRVDAPKISAPIYKPYVSHILSHLLRNAAVYTPEGGSIWLDFKKRGPHTYQFIVSDTGKGIPEEERENVFKPFLQIHDLTEGDGLGLPICRQMAVNMNGDLTIDPTFTKGTRFVLELKKG